MEKGSRSGLMDPFTKDGGSMIKLMEKEDLFMEMEMCMKETGTRTRLTDLEYILIQMEPPTQENGEMTSSMDMGSKHGLIMLNMKEIIEMARRKARASSCGQMALNLRETSGIITSMAKVLKLITLRSVCVE